MQFIPCPKCGEQISAEAPTCPFCGLKSPARYQQAARVGALDGGDSPLVESREPLDAEARLRERIMLGLRLRDGFDLEGAAASLGIAAWPAQRRRAADRCIAQGRLVVEGGHLRLPASARIYADGVAAALF
mgnify:CR=1 FL=1